MGHDETPSRPRGARLVPFALAAAVGVALACAATAEPPAGPGDAAAELDAKLAAGQAHLTYRPGSGYLASLLQNLRIPVDSQVLVFSKTSLQVERISPRTPRSIYFNDNVAVGAAQGGRLFEILANDPKSGLAFYTLDTAQTASPRLERQGPECLSCHAQLNPWAPGMIVANVVPQADGTPLPITTGKLFDVTDTRTPYDQRWGGWYVTGTSGAMRHDGNTMMRPEDPNSFDPHAGGNVTDLSGRFDVKPYLTASSDITALMTLEHQVGATNLIGQINAQLKSLRGETSAGPRATQADVDASIEALVRYLLYLDEPRLPDPVKGVSSFAETFSAQGPRDAKGRGLHQLDLKTRLARYPLSFMIGPGDRRGHQARPAGLLARRRPSRALKPAQDLGATQA
ncbi:MAG TPA: hypothetical protein VHV27_10580 [Phenylobacterium sp.]|nr:hypothetical protein [Phenylobacterium sp.]